MPTHQAKNVTMPAEWYPLPDSGPPFEESAPRSVSVNM